MFSPQDQWLSTWDKLGLSTPDGHLLELLVAHYSEPHRKYHTLQHVEECFAKLEEVRSDVVRLGEIEMALWFHDAIYDVRNHGNEEKSAEWACTCLRAAGAAEEMVQRVRSLIMTTAHHQAADDSDARILVDVDLSILGASPARFREYDRQIREEYRHVPEPVFVEHRRRVLKGFLQRPRIFNTETFFERYEQQARENLTESLHGNARS